MSRPVALLVGVGPGVGAALARLLAAEGWDLALLGRQQPVLEGLAAELTGEVAGGPAGQPGEVAVGWAVVDLTDVAATTAAITRLGEHAGRLDLVHVNPSAWRSADPLELSVDDLLADVALGVGTLLTAVQAARPFLTPGARVTVTGSVAADDPDPAAASLGVQKAGVRNLVHSLDRALQPLGARAVSLTVRGALADDGPFSPDRVAAAVLAAARQDEAAWRSEVPWDGDPSSATTG